MLRFSLSLSPNNEVRFGWSDLPHKGRKSMGGDGQAQRKKSRMDAHHYNVLANLVQGCSGGIIENYYDPEKSEVLTRLEVETWKARKIHSLDFLSKVQHDKQEDREIAQIAYREDLLERGLDLDDVQEVGKAKFSNRCGFGLRSGGAYSLTRRARQRILAAASLLSRRAEDPSLGALATFTIPGGDADAKSRGGRWSGYLVNRLLQPIRRHNSKRHTADIEWFYSWEFQKRGVLHLHLFLWSSEVGVAESMGKSLIPLWWTSLQDCDCADGGSFFTRADGRACTVSRYWQADVQPVRRDISKYVSKYVSKKSSSSSRDRYIRKSTAPGRAWGMARSLVKAVVSSSSTLVLEGLSESVVSELVLGLNEFCAKLKPVQSYSYSYPVIWSGREVGSGFACVAYLERSQFDSLVLNWFQIVQSLLGKEKPPVVGGSSWLYLRSQGVLAVPSYLL